METVGFSACELGSDVCAIRPKTKWGEGLPEEQLNAGIALGEDVVYCGFPLGMSMQDMPESNGYPTPLIKAAIMSGSTERGKIKECLFDTLNNKGFSGGPIIKRDPKDGKLRVVGVVSRYKFDAPIPIYKKRPDGSFEEEADYVVRPNSGFMIGIPFFLALNAAEKLI